MFGYFEKAIQGRCRGSPAPLGGVGEGPDSIDSHRVDQGGDEANAGKKVSSEFVSLS
jgi:hypothetical protein